ncbi:unnamed protein product [Brassica rapa subsp. trilocularis]
MKLVWSPETASNAYIHTVIERVKLQRIECSRVFIGYGGWMEHEADRGDLEAWRPYRHQCRTSCSSHTYPRKTHMHSS